MIYLDKALTKTWFTSLFLQMTGFRWYLFLLVLGIKGRASGMLGKHYYWVASLVLHSFLWLDSIPLYIYATCLYLFINCRHLGCFYFLAIVKSATLNMGLKMSLSFFFLFSTGCWTQDLTHARQVVYHLTTSPGLFILSCLGWPQTFDPLASASQAVGITDMDHQAWHQLLFLNYEINLVEV